MTKSEETAPVAVATQQDLQRAARDIAAVLVRGIAESAPEPEASPRPWTLLASRRARFRHQSWQAQIEDALLQILQSGNESLANAAEQLRRAREGQREAEAQAERLAAEAARLQRAAADDLRDAGLTLAHHSDRRSGGDLSTSWLFITPDGRALRGDARGDAEALDQIRAALGADDPDRD